LLIRSAFFHWHMRTFKDSVPYLVPVFEQHVSLMTYGDDCKGSVSRTLHGFDHITVATFLEARDIIFTMPDKSSDRKPFLKDEDCDFLKRKNVYHPELKHILGALDETSIMKSLHSNVKSSAISQVELSVQVLDGALFEWFAHGRDVYESRREQVLQVAERHGLVSSCRNLRKTYDDWVDEWKTQYRPGDDSSITSHYVSSLSDDSSDF